MLQGLGRRSATFGDKVIEENPDGTTTTTYIDAPETTNRFAKECPPGLLQDEYVKTQIAIEAFLEAERTQTFRGFLSGLGVRLPPAKPKF
jgi:MoxR-like ATPase